MIVLAFDTATPDTVVGLTGAGEPVELRHTPGADERPGHAAQLLPLARAALERAGLEWNQVDRIGVGVGPGSFTGLRIGVATARALAQSAGAGPVPVSTLEALAEPVEGAVLACLDARRGEAFVAAYDGTTCLLAPAAVTPEELAELGEGRIAVGDGALRYRAELTTAEVPPDDSPLHRVSGLALCRLAARGEPVPRDELLPEYLREPDARPRHN